MPYGYTISETQFAGAVDKDGPLYTGRFHSIDINRDGVTDLFATLQFQDQHGPAPYVAFLGDGDGGFDIAPKSTLRDAGDGSVSAREAVSGDFNGDGREDIFIADHGTDWGGFLGYTNQLLLGSKHGLVAAPGRIPEVADFSHSATVGDIDSDGDLDIYVGNLQWEEPPGLLINDGAGRFEFNVARLPEELRATSLDTHSSYTTSLLVDVDRDKDLDLFLGSDQSGHFLALNDGSGMFTKAPEPVPAGAYGAGKTIALDAQPFDFNADGIDDIIVSATRSDPFYTDTKLQVLISTGDGGLIDRTKAYLDAQPAIPRGYVNFINLVDLNNDGFQDFIAEVHGPEKHLIYFNDGENRFYKLPPSLVPFDVWGGPLVVADVNRDGWSDFVTWNLRGGLEGGEEHNLRVAAKTPISSGLVEGSGQADTVLAGPGTQTIDGKGGKDFLAGGQGGDSLVGRGGTDKLFGGDGNDHIDGGAGKDLLVGGAKNDTLSGGGSKDVIVGGAGRDTLEGGSGADRYVYREASDSRQSAKKRDTIADFARSENDRIDLKAIDADVSSAKDDAFAFVGTQKFSKTAGELRYARKDGATFVYGDIDGNGKADFAIKLAGAVDLVKDDFVL